MKLIKPGKRIEAARELRSHSTLAEEKLWSVLRRHAFGLYKFRRQFPIGPYFADFCCIARRLVIEVDGGYHAQTIDSDMNRTYALENELGFRVIRFTNDEVISDLAGVLAKISQELKKPFPPPLGEGGLRPTGAVGEVR